MRIRQSACSYLPGSAVFVPTALRPEHPDVCVTAERPCSVLNVACCIATCKFYRVPIVSAYRSSLTNFVDFIDDFYHVLSYLSSFTNHIIAGPEEANLRCPGHCH